MKFGSKTGVGSSGWSAVSGMWRARLVVSGWGEHDCQFSRPGGRCEDRTRRASGSKLTHNGWYLPTLESSTLVKKQQPRQTSLPQTRASGTDPNICQSGSDQNARADKTTRRTLRVRRTPSESPYLYEDTTEMTGWKDELLDVCEKGGLGCFDWRFRQAQLNALYL